MDRRVALVTALLVASACALNSRPTLSPSRMAELWKEPTDLARRDLLHGPGGPELTPDPDGRYDLLEVDTKGFSPGYDVKDTEGRSWSVKLGPEARTEVVVSRLTWAVGYHQPFIYHVPRWTLTRDGAATPQPPARFRLEPPTQQKVGTWSWRDNPFLDTQPMAGLFVLMVMVNNWDVKTLQNVLYRIEDAEDGPRQWYVVKDLGASLGKTNWFFPGVRDDLDAFEREPFIERVEGNRVRFYYRGAWQEPHLISDVTPDDVRWTCELLARLSPRQWMDAFRAGGYSDEDAGRYIRRFQQKIREGLKLGPHARVR